MPNSEKAKSLEPQLIIIAITKLCTIYHKEMHEREIFIVVSLQGNETQTQKLVKVSTT